MEDKQRKKISRTMLRKHCKKIEESVDALLANLPEDGVEKLLALKLNYETQMNKINIANEEVAKLITSEDELEKDLEESLVLEDIFYETLTKINNHLETLKPKSDVKSPVVQNSSPAALRSSPVKQNVKLPKIDLKSFDGNILNWQTSSNRTFTITITITIKPNYRK